jgi:hypothetical protein
MRQRPAAVKSIPARRGGTVWTCANIAPRCLFQRETKNSIVVNARKRRKGLRFFGKKKSRRRRL